MKEIKAYIKPHKLGDVARALQRVEGLRGMSVVEVKGFGRREDDDAYHPSVDDLMDFARYSKIEIFCHDDLAEELVSVIEKHAYTGLRGDGKIYVSDLDKAFKIGKGRIG
jgi:nitrogen regulatory protein PII